MLNDTQYKKSTSFLQQQLKAVVQWNVT